MRVFYHLFPWRTTAILLIMLTVASVLFFLAYNSWEDKEHPIALHRAYFAVINLTFFQVNYSELPQNPWMDIFTILVPLIGLPLFSLFGLRVLHVIRHLLFAARAGAGWQEAADSLIAEKPHCGVRPGQSGLSRGRRPGF